MKKIITAMLIAAMSFSLVACNNTSSHNTAESSTESVAEVATSATELLTGTYDAFAEKLAPTYEMTAEDLKAMFMGGYYNENDETTLTQGPGAVPVNDASILTIGLLPEESVGLIDDASLLQHPMMTNNFAAMAFHVTDAANLDSVAEALDNAVKNNQWMCGQPDGYVIVQVGSYVVSIYGLTDNINALKDALTETYESAVIAYEGSFTEHTTY